MGTTIHRLEVHPSQHMLRSSSNNLQAISNKQRLWNLQTTMWQVLNSIGNKVNRIPHKITQANIWYEQLWRDIFTGNLGSTSLNVTMDKHSQNSSHPQRNKRTITTTSTATCGAITNLQSGENNDHGILQSHNSIQQVKTTNNIKCQHKPWWRNSTNGHLSN